MTLKSYQKLNKIIQQGLKELELEAIKKGVLFSPQHEKAILEVKKRIVERAGLKLEEYLKIEEMDEGSQNLDKKSIYLLLEETKSQLLKKVPTEKDIKGIANIIAQQYIKPPQIINKIVQVKEKPIIQKFYDTALIEELKKDLLFLQNAYTEDYGKIPRQHSDLLAITPNDHHQEMHSIMYHLGDEYLKRFKDLIEKTETPQVSGQGFGSGFSADEIWKQTRATKKISLRRSDYSLDSALIGIGIGTLVGIGDGIEDTFTLPFTPSVPDEVILFVGGAPKFPVDDFILTEDDTKAVFVTPPRNNQKVRILAQK